MPNFGAFLLNKLNFCNLFRGIEKHKNKFAFWQFLMGRYHQKKKVSKLRFIAELKAFDGTCINSAMPNFGTFLLNKLNFCILYQGIIKTPTQFLFHDTVYKNIWINSPFDNFYPCDEDIIEKGVEVKVHCQTYVFDGTECTGTVLYILLWPKNTVGADVILSGGSFDHYCFPPSSLSSPSPSPPLGPIIIRNTCSGRPLNTVHTIMFTCIR
jgi:hypothetical protein